MEPKVFTIFKNTYVHIICAHLRSTQGKQSGHIVSEGFVTDFCTDYLYLSPEPMGDITEAIKLVDIVKIYLPIAELSAIMESQGFTEDMQ